MKITCTNATVQYLREQFCGLQACDSMLKPRQAFSPFEGGELVQSRTLFWLPPPHLTEQGPQGPQEDQPLSTPSIRKYTENYIKWA